MRLLIPLLTFAFVAPLFAVDMDDVAARVNRMEHRVSTIEKKMFGGNMPTADGSTVMADFQIRLEELEKENTTLYGSVEQLGRAVEELAKQVKTMNEDIVLRLQDLETGAAMAKKPSKAQAEPTAATESASQSVLDKPTALQVPEKLSATELYGTAYQALTTADYDKAKLWFNTLVERYKVGESTENAYHWLGEIHLVEGNPTEAVVAIKNGITAFPKSDKVPSYLKKMGEAFVQLDKNHHAQSVWQKLLDDHADTPEAAQVKPKLEALLADKEG